MELIGSRPADIKKINMSISSMKLRNMSIEMIRFAESRMHQARKIHIQDNI